MNKNVRSIVKTGFILFVIGFLCTLILSVCNYMTKGTIERLAAASEREAMVATLSEADHFVKLPHIGEGIVTGVFEGVDKDKNIVGYCVKVYPVGYGGEISMIVGIDTDHKVTGVDIVNMSETPGLGAKAKDESFYNQYIGKSGLVSVKKSGTPNENEISAISGATVTSKAVTQGVNAALEIVKKLR